jgi:hypothetical protein
MIRDRFYSQDYYKLRKAEKAKNAILILMVFIVGSVLAILALNAWDHDYAKLQERGNYYVEK